MISYCEIETYDVSTAFRGLHQKKAGTQLVWISERGRNAKVSKFLVLFWLKCVIWTYFRATPSFLSRRRLDFRWLGAILNKTAFEEPFLQRPFTCCW